MSAPRRDRSGELVDEPPEGAEPEHVCQNGYLGEDHEGRPRPCPICKPNLLNTRDRLEEQMTGRRHWSTRPNRRKP